jgi:cytochrome c-type biogenesis protein CcmH
MILWPILTLMTLGAVIAVWWPLARRQGSVRSGSDIAVYRDQLDEIDRDQAASRIGNAEAEAARVEVSRRLIAAAETAKARSVAAAAGPAGWYRRATLAVAIVLLPVGAGAVYLSLGSPGLVSVSMNAATDGQPLPAGIEHTVAEVETYMESNPRNGRGWELLAPVYLRLGRFDDAVRARRNALEIFGPDAAHLGDLGEAMVMASGGVVTAEAKSLFERANAAAPEDVMAQYYLGLSAKQDGRRDEAEKRWRVLVSRAGEGAEWLPLVKDALARIDEKSPSVVVAAPASGAAKVAPKGPSAREVAAAAQLAPAERNGMIEGMVARLAQKMAENGSDVEGWLRLIKAYSVLGERDKALAAAAHARSALADDNDNLRRIGELAKELGLEGS